MKYLSYLYLIIGCVAAISIHQYITALVSTRQGDPKPKNKNRLTLNPFSHIEPIGFICMIMSGGYGWGNPVETAPVYYSDRKKGTLITYIVPSMVNLLIGAIFALLGNIFMYLMMENAQSSQVVQNILLNLHTCLYLIASVNIRLALFNMIPIYPLDAWKVLGAVVSPTTLVKLTNYEKMLQMLLVFLLVSGMVESVLGPMADVFLSLSNIKL